MPTNEEVLQFQEALREYLELPREKQDEYLESMSESQKWAFCMSSIVALFGPLLPLLNPSVPLWPMPFRR